MVYYNEFDHPKAVWLRELIKAGVIADGEVDERSIADVKPNDLRGFRQIHLFAGIGIWSYALRLAGWPDDRECWTASCPCQPFSAAGKKENFADRRHLWPECFRLVKARKPVVLFGEQVSNKHGLAWLDLVSDNLEALAYAIGATNICAAGVGAPHARNRLYFVADSDKGSGGKGRGARSGKAQSGRSRNRSSGYGDAGFVGHPNGTGPQRRVIGRDGTNERATGSASLVIGVDDTANARLTGIRISREAGTSRDGARLPEPSGRSASGGMEHAAGDGWIERWPKSGGRSIESRCGDAGALADTSEERIRALRYRGAESAPRGMQGIDGQRERIRVDAREPGPVNGFWADAEWIYCRPEREGEAGKYRPTQPAALGMDDELAGNLGRMRVPCLGSPEGREIYFPLIQKGKARIQRLHGYGDGIVAEAAAQFIHAYIEETEER